MFYLIELLLGVLLLQALEWVLRLGKRGRLVLAIMWLIWAVVDAGLTALANPGQAVLPSIISFCDSMIPLGLWQWISSWIRQSRERKAQSALAVAGLAGGKPTNNLEREFNQAIAEIEKTETDSKEIQVILEHDPKIEEFNQVVREQPHRIPLGEQSDIAPIWRVNPDSPGILRISTDAAKLLFPEYVADPQGADRHVTATAERIAENVLDTMLATIPEPWRDIVLIGSGIPGSGKTSTLSAPTHPAVCFTIEEVMDDYEKSRALIRRVLDSGRRPLILWMYLDDVAKAVERMFRRAQAIGRTDQLDHITSAYKQVPEVLSALGREFPTSVSIYIADNSRNRCEQEFVQSRVLGYDTQLASEVAQAQVWSVNQMFHDKPTFEVAY